MTVPPRRQMDRWWRTWLLLDTGDLVHSLLYLLGIVIMLSHEDYAAVGQRVLIVSSLVGLLLVDRVEVWRFGTHPPVLIGFGAALVRLTLFGAFMRLTAGELTSLMLFLAPHIGLRYPSVGGDRRLGWILWLLTSILIAYPIVLEWRALLGWSSYLQATLEVLDLLILVVLGWMASRIVLNEATDRRHTEHLLEELQAAYDSLRSSTQRELATIEERNQLARDIHDGLGHYLTVINVQLEKALAFRERDPAVADQAVQHARRLADEALREVRSSVGMLDRAQESFSLTDAMQGLVANIRDSLPVDLQIVGSEANFAPQVLMTLYRVAQEGLTNIQKHAHANQGQLCLTLGEHEATLDICDNGRGFVPEHLGSLGCSGLLGLRERLELVGGSVQIVSTPTGGTHLHVVVPCTVLVAQTQARAEEKARP